MRRAAGVAFAADLAHEHNARLILQHVIRPQDRTEVLASHTLDEIETNLMHLVPQKLRNRLPSRRSLCLATRPRNCCTRARRNRPT